MYLTRFQKVYPFSLPFTFDIENTWVSLALIEEKTSLKATEDHAEILKRAFMQKKILIIEGDPATGKTSLMRRLTYEWAKGKEELLCYDLVLYAEYREVREQTFQSIADMVLGGLEKYLTKEGYENLKKLLNNEQFCEEGRILILLDGYDESSLEKQCSELKMYLSNSRIDEAFVFNVVITIRKDPSTNRKGREGRFVFAEVLSFTTEQQKQKYLYNHFLSSSEIDSKRNIEAVHSLLSNNQNLNQLAEKPVFLMFICLVHGRIVDGTLLELYCNIIWWLIDRHQHDFSNRDIPCDFGFQNGSKDKFQTIQEHYLHFPQLHCLGKMALRSLHKNVFIYLDCEQFNLQPILIEQVGLLRKEKKYDDPLKPITSFFFPHKTIQEFLAAFCYFCSNDPKDEWLFPHSEINTYKMNEFESFLLRIALSDKMPVQPEKRKYYLERITDIDLNTTFDAFKTKAGFNNKLLNWFLSQCINVQNIDLRGQLNSVIHARDTLNATAIRNKSAFIFQFHSSTLLSFNDLTKLLSVSFWNWTFEANSQLSFTNCLSMKKLQFKQCKIDSGTNFGIVTLPAIDTVDFKHCKIDLTTGQLILDQIRNSSIKYLKLTLAKDFNEKFFIHLQKCSNIEKLDITIDNSIILQNDFLPFCNLIKLHSLSFEGSTFEDSSRLLFTNCPSLFSLKFKECKTDSATWQSIIDQISNSSVKCLKLTFGEDFNEEFLIHLQKCNVEKMKITIKKYKIRQNYPVSLNELTKLRYLSFEKCTFEAYSQLSFTNFPFLTHLKFSECTFEANSMLRFQMPPPKMTYSRDFTYQPIYIYPTNFSSLWNLKFKRCEIGSNTSLGIGSVAVHYMGFDQCAIDLTTWQSITDQIKGGPVSCLQLSADYYVEERHPEFSNHLQKWRNVSQIHILDFYDRNVHDHILNLYEEEVTANLEQTVQHLPELTSIIITGEHGKRLNESRKLKERNKQRIEKAGQGRYSKLLIKYEEEILS